MANKWAVANGNWSAGATWNGGTLPTSADDAFADGFTVTIDQTITVLSIRTTQRSGGTAGGSFTVSGAHTINAVCISGTTTCLTSTATSGTTVTVNGNSTGGSVAGSHGINNSSTGTIVVTGNMLGGTSNSATPSSGIFNASTGIATVIGNSTGGGANGTHGTYNNAAGTITITGSITGGGGGAQGLFNNGAGTINVTGNSTGGSSGSPSASFPSYGILNNSTGAVNVIGNCGSGSLANGFIAGLYNASTGAVSITGNLTAQSSYAVWCAGTGSLTVNAVTINASTSNIAIFSSAANIIDLTGTINGSNAFSAVYALTATVKVRGNMVGANGINPVCCTKLNIDPTASQTWTLQDTTNTDRSLFTANALSTFPAVTDVRSGVIYASGSLTGTCAVPPALSVAFGVPVDNTTGLSIITRAQLITDVGAIVAAYTV
jgi:hypothetical protein